MTVINLQPHALSPSRPFFSLRPNKIDCRHIKASSHLLFFGPPLIQDLILPHYLFVDISCFPHKARLVDNNSKSTILDNDINLFFKLNPTTTTATTTTK